MSGGVKLSVEIPSLPPPSLHTHESCLEGWKKRRNRARNQIIFGLAWHHSYLVGCTSIGTILLWDLPDDNEADEDIVARDYYKKQRISEKTMVAVSHGQTTTTTGRTPIFT